MEMDISAFEDKILRTLWRLSAGTPKLINIKCLYQTLTEDTPEIDRDRLEVCLEKLEKAQLLVSRKGKAGFIMAKVSELAVTHIHENQPGIPSFYTRNLEALNDKELKTFLEELTLKLPESEVDSQDYRLKKDKIEQIKYILAHRQIPKARRISIISLIIATLAVLGTIAQVVISYLSRP